MTIEASRAYRRGVYGAFLALLFAGNLCTSARATGGSNISSAPAVVYGQQEFGNTASDGGNNPTGGHPCHQPHTNGWWTLAVATGDEVTIDWEAPQTQYLEVLPPGTTDFTAPQAKEFASSAISNNGHAQLRFTATTGGIMPLVIGVDACASFGDPGPYSFTAYVTHALRLFLPRLSRLHSGAVQVGVHTPDGIPITDSNLSVEVQGRWHGRWYRLGNASPSSGLATVALRVPRSWRGHRLTLRAVAQGNAYQTASSNSERVRVA